MTIAKLKAETVFRESAYITKLTLTTRFIADGNFNALKVDKKYIDCLKPSTHAKIKDKLIEISLN